MVLLFPFLLGEEDGVGIICGKDTLFVGSSRVEDDWEGRVAIGGKALDDLFIGEEIEIRYKDSNS